MKTTMNHAKKILPAPVQKLKLPGAHYKRRDFLKILSSAALLSSCTKPGKTENPPPITPPNVILVVMDTVRSQSASLHGYHRNTTPSLMRMAKKAQVYTNAISPASWTLPAHAALFTGQHPFISGVHTWFDETMGKNGYYVPALPQSQVTLAEFFQEKGYATGAFVANTGYLGKPWQFDQGFATYILERIPALDLITQATHWADSAKQKPFFAFVNLMDAHYPINCATVPGLLEGEVNPDPQIYSDFDKATLGGDKATAARLHGLVVDQYDTGIANADKGVGMLLDWLEKTGLDKNTLLVVTSDHGEFLGEHGISGHSKDVYDQVVHVPLLVQGPNLPAKTMDERMSLVEVPRIILDQCFGNKAQSEAPSFYKPESTNMPVIAENYFAREWDLFDVPWGDRFKRIRAAIYDGQWKFIWSSDGKHELYDLANDAGELRNLVSTQPKESARLEKKLLSAWDGNIRKNVPANEVEYLDQNVEQLKALGYIGEDTPKKEVPSR